MFNKYGIKLIKNKIPHALLLEDSNREKSLMCALDISKFLECESIINTDDNSESENFCSQCKNCAKIDKKVHSDVKVISASGKTIGIDLIRSVREDAFILPNEAQFKIYIIDGADTMTLQAQNALLKILEEPPKYVVFILLCSFPGAMLSTVLSRVQAFSLSKENCKETEDYAFSKDLMLSLLYDDYLLSLSKAEQITKDREFFSDILVSMNELIVRCILYEINGRIAEDNDKCYYDKVLKKLDKSKLVRMIKIVDEIKSLLNKNANMNLSAVVLHSAFLEVI